MIFIYFCYHIHLVSIVVIGSIFCVTIFDFLLFSKNKIALNLSICVSLCILRMVETWFQCASWRSLDAKFHICFLLEDLKEIGFGLNRLLNKTKHNFCVGKYLRRIQQKPYCCPNNWNFVIFKDSVTFCVQVCYIVGMGLCTSYENKIK